MEDYETRDFEEYLGGVISSQLLESYGVVRDQEGLQRLLKEKKPYNGDTPPSVDFDEEMLIYAFLGQQMPGHYINIMEIIERPDSLEVCVEKKSLPPAKENEGLITHPFQIVTTEKSDKPVSYTINIKS